MNLVKFELWNDFFSRHTDHNKLLTIHWYLIFFSILGTARRWSYYYKIPWALRVATYYIISHLNLQFQRPKYHFKYSITHFDRQFCLPISNVTLVSVSTLTGLHDFGSLLWWSLFLNAVSSMWPPKKVGAFFKFHFHIQELLSASQLESDGFFKTSQHRLICNKKQFWVRLLTEIKTSHPWALHYHATNISKVGGVSKTMIKGYILYTVFFLIFHNFKGRKYTNVKK